MYNSGIGTPYWFEWEIGILECLNMLQDTSIESVILQSTDFQALDDVVVNYSDKSILNIQVKHTDEDANFTYSFLASGKKPLLNALALEWKNNKDNYNFKGIQIVTNKKWGPQEIDGKCSMDDFISTVFPCLQDNYNYTSAKPNEQKAIEWYRENLEINLDSNEAACFTKIFSFRKESCLADVEEKIRVKIGEILGTDNSDAIDFCLNSLLSKLNIWATSRREKQEITRENVYGALCYTEPDVPSYELCPEKPILPSRQRFGETFIDDIKKNSNHIIFLEGLPGCGKTNFISYLSQMNESIVDFRFYTYLPVNKVDGSYSDDEGFYLGNILWRSILVQLKKKFEENNLLSVVKFPLIYQFMSVSEMRETVIHFLPEYAKCIGRPCYFFIDGLDHAARSKDARNSFLSQLPRPEEIGDDFYFVLVGQPINDGYPSWMKDNKGITYYSMPALDTDDVVILLEQSGVAENTVDMENLAKTVISVIGNNVLNIIFAILELKKMVLPLSFEAIEKELNSRFLNKQIDKYYEWIISSQEKSLLLYKIEAIMAFSSKRINAYDVAQMCGVEHDEAAFVLNGLYPIIVCEGDRYFAFHNDVRLFLQNAIIHNSNIKGITESIINRIKQDRELWKYRYDISFNLLVSCKATDEVLKLIDVEYVMDSALYGISFDRILQQFILAHQLPMDNLEEVCIHSSAVSLCLAQYANCIQYYAKESDYFEAQSINKKTKAEKYCLNVKNDIEQIILDIDFAAKAGFERGHKLFDEYLSGYNIEELLSGELKKETLVKAGYIYRCYGADYMEALTGNSNDYVYFVDGWLDASVCLTSKEDIRQTFTFKWYNPDSLYEYIHQIAEEKNLEKESFDELLDILLGMCAPIEIIIEICTYGLLNSYKCEAGIEYVSNHLNDIKKIDSNYKYEDLRIISLIKAKLCLFGRIEEALIEKCYKEILNLTHNGESQRGYKPALAQYDIAKHVSEQFYSSDRKEVLSKDDIFSLMYFADKYGPGSVNDCNGYTVMRFLRKVLVSFSEHNPKAGIIDTICKAVVQCLEWEKTRFVPEFNKLFCISNAHAEFLKVAEYWCGIDGVAWKSEYDEMEDFCKYIIPALEYFGEKNFIEEIREKQKYKMFGYVGRKDYSLNGLLDCYKKLPLNEEKLCCYGMRLFSVSNLADSIGDNRFSSEVDRELLEDAVKLGYKYCNALFELKNHPKDLVYWRMKVLDSLYCNIDLISGDSELLALYKLTNSWIKVNIENDREYNRLETLKSYNYEIISRISSHEIREKLMAKGLYDKAEQKDFSVETGRDYNLEIINLLKEDGYNEKAEGVIITQIEKREIGLHKLIMEAGDIIAPKHMEEYVNRCVVKFILSESKYGYIGSGISDVFERYYEMFNDDTWILLFENIVTRFAESDYGTIASLWGDFTIFSIHYLSRRDKDKIKALFDCLCKTHESLSSANGRVKIKEEKLILDENITSLSDMVNFQLNI